MWSLYCSLNLYSQILQDIFLHKEIKNHSQVSIHKLMIPSNIIMHSIRDLATHREIASLRVYVVLCACVCMHKVSLLKSSHKKYSQYSTIQTAGCAAWTVKTVKFYYFRVKFYSEAKNSSAQCIITQACTLQRKFGINSKHYHPSLQASQLCTYNLMHLD